MSDSSPEAYEQVEVWRFRRLDVRSGQYVTSIGKAEVATIERFGAEPIPDSMETVPQHKLDGNRIYTPPMAPMSPAARRRLERLRPSTPACSPKRTTHASRAGQSESRCCR